MNVKYGNGKTKYGPGVSIELTGVEVARAIGAWLAAHGVEVSGARTITVNGEFCETGHVYVDPEGFVITDGKKFSGSGPADPNRPGRTTPGP
jgi:lipoate-protein ligase A